MALIDVVRWDEPGDVLAWRFPNSELSTGTRVFVNESQEAMLFKGGKLFDTFGPGAHTLSTENIPLLNKVINLPFGGKSPFSAEIWFVNKAISLDVRWGTTDPIQVEDPKYGIIIPVRAFGQLGMQISDSGAFLTKLVGATASFGRAELSSFFKGIVMARVKSAVAAAIVRSGVSILEISSELQALSEKLEAEIAPDLRPFGVELIAFRMISINVPEDDESVRSLKQAKSTAARRRIEGTSYPQERSYDVVEGAARNPGTGGGVVSAAVGLGVGIAAARTVADMTVGVTRNLPPLSGLAGNGLGGSSNPSATAAAAYFMVLAGEEVGPLELATLQQRVASGEVTPETPVWRYGLDQWTSVRQLPELCHLFPPPREGR